MNMVAATFQIRYKIYKIYKIYTLLEIEIHNEIVNILNNFQNTCCQYRTWLRSWFCWFIKTTWTM